MSISSLALLLNMLSVAVPASQPILNPAPTAPAPTITVEQSLILFAITGLMTVAGITIAILFKVYQPRNVIGPRRLAPKGKAAILLLSLGVGVLAWLMPQTVFGSFKGEQLKRQGIELTNEHLQAAMTPKDLAILSTVPQVVAFGIMLTILLLAGNDMVGRLGLRLNKIWVGLLAGVLAFIVVFPMVTWGAGVTEIVYRAIGYHHAGEHELLKSFGEAHGGAVSFVIVLGATVCGPIFEEMLFRAHLQTLLRHLFLKLSGKADLPEPEPQNAPPPLPMSVANQSMWLVPPPPPPMVDAVPLPAIPIEYRSPPATLPPQQPAWPSWLAIVITAAIFALVHPIWMSPLIFILAIGLGYIYERTGILWACIAVHMLFNSVNTIQYYFLFMRH